MKFILILLFILISGVLNETTPKLADKSKTILVNKCCGEDEIFHESECVKASTRDVTGELELDKTKLKVISVIVIHGLMKT